MKNIEAVRAYMALDRLKDQPMDLASSYRLMRLRQRLAPCYAIYSELEDQLIGKYDGHNKMRGNVILFGDDEAARETARKFDEEHRQLDGADAEIDAGKKVRIDARGIRISMADMEALDGLVEFCGLEEGEDDGNGCSCGG